ncbi:MAG TPA: PBP1A family penicillin-binding protein [Nitrospirae bacterium]|nr:PBP1A family penicillin-binding protein [Nitrospirota bacterium]HDL19675.1 PBP1A family penicillin-binding protein [Nitrospirota bacterium]HDZ03079.1 PBP1A family penicillin-binding protein [Nitrospirota bacterium]
MKRFIIRSFFLILVIALGILTGGYLALIKGVPHLEEIKGYMPANGTEVYADDDTLIGEFKVEKGEYVAINKIPEQMIRAVVAIEDTRFWMHRGVDYIAILRALSKDIRAGRIKEGASTITQQLAKVVFLSPERTVMRKLREATLASRIEKNLTKEEILELYLNKIYFGHGAYGVEMAARAYFGKSISDVNLAEAALLAGLIKAPSRYSPYSNLDKAKQRQYIVLRRMADEGYISREQAAEAYEQPLYLSSVRYEKYTPNYFLEYIRKYLEDEYGVEMTYKGGLRVYTTLNKKVQFAAVNSLKKGLRRLDKRQGYRGPLDHKDVNLKDELANKGNFTKIVIKQGDIVTGTVLKVSASKAVIKTGDVIGNLFLSGAKWAKKLIDSQGNVIKEFRKLRLTNILKAGDVIRVKVKDLSSRKPLFTLEQDPVVQGAVVAIEPSTGYIRAIVGGYDFRKSEFNRAVFAKRQAGSVFKPITYAAALDNGYTPASLIIDEPLIYESEKYGDWEPENYDEKYHGATRLRDALAYSRNIVTVKLLEEVGVNKVIKFARSIGIKGPFPHNLTLGLGSLSVSPLEMTSAFCVFAQGGIRMAPIAVKYIIDADGNVLENNIPEGVRVISPQTAFLATSMLEDVVKYGTGWRAKALRRPVAGKTGTTNEYKDAWFIGYTPELAAGVWVGFDNMRTLGDGETGSKAAAPVWVNFMKKALTEISPFDSKDVEKKPFPVPDGIVTAVIDPLTGLLATNETRKMVEFFKEGTVPTIYSTYFYRDLILRQKKELRKIKKEKDDKK